MADDFRGGDEHPDEQLLLGLVIANVDLLQQVAMLHGEHFRLKSHAVLFSRIAVIRKQSIDDIRASRHENAQYAAKLIDAAARRAKGDEELAEVLVRACAEKIIGSIRTIEDRANWYEQLFAACGSEKIGPSEYLLGVAIGRHVKRATGSCYPGTVLLAKETGLGVRSVERGTGVLRDKKHLHVDRKRPATFVPIVWAKIKAAKDAVECTQPTITAKTAPQTPAGAMDDEIPF